MKRKKGYETPLIEKFRVELEEGVCATGSIMSDAKSGVVATKHETGFDGSYNIDDPNSSSFEVSDWN